ncbi:Rv3654c family TadE-like protein [Nocardiopsis suaedae]|uniref:Pilus assembly protein TadG-related protein n=1 Tax=Nocardiopsis suaedae TaxID=3018444 RepID=A0ABT4TVF2_9ACTN|nr:Rv3654c family TadE-like protein [Nocardiopsis suaedae]MDA2808219.1 pilus assembly protein TadG-related protein [Nocardiopsis suaedae]
MDNGSGTVWVLVVCALVWTAAAAAVVVGGARVDRHHAGTAADLAALAGARRAAEGADRSCAAATRTAEANGARVEACAVDGLEVVVEVSVPVRTWPTRAHAEARAGPVEAKAYG